jgi:hypothetical protein
MFPLWSSRRFAAEEAPTKHLDSASVAPPRPLDLTRFLGVPGRPAILTDLITPVCTESADCACSGVIEALNLNDQGPVNPSGPSENLEREAGIEPATLSLGNQAGGILEALAWTRAR